MSLEPGGRRSQRLKVGDDRIRSSSKSAEQGRSLYPAMDDGRLFLLFNEFSASPSPCAGICLQTRVVVVGQIALPVDVVFGGVVITLAARDGDGAMFVIVGQIALPIDVVFGGVVVITRAARDGDGVMFVVVGQIAASVDVVFCGESFFCGRIHYFGANPFFVGKSIF